MTGSNLTLFSLFTASSSFIFIYSFLLSHKNIDSDFLKILGIRRDGLFPAMLSSIGLTGTLFLGPFIQKFLQNDQKTENSLHNNNFDFLISFRTLIAAPITEELVYRACLVPLLFKFCDSSAKLIFTVPLFFGVAHTHHLFEKIFILKQDVKTSVILTVVQLTYTTIFGAMSTFFYVKTAHLPAVIAMHALCNYFGLPNFGKVWFEQNKLKKYSLIGFYVLGLVGFGFGCSLIKATDYDNDVFY